MSLVDHLQTVVRKWTVLVPLLLCDVTKIFLIFISEYQLSLKGRWKSGFNAGGWLECPTFHENPQYIITIHPDSKSLYQLIKSLFQFYKLTAYSLFKHYI